jgi:hypothetical protein
MKGILRGVQHTPGSGLVLVLVERAGVTHRIPADAGPFYRALRAAFGPDSYFGRWIEFDVDDVGAMTGFSPINVGATTPDD